MSDEKLQVRLTRSAVERLMETNPEVTIKLSQQVAEQVLEKRFLKAIENSDTIRVALGEIQTLIDKKVSEVVGGQVTRIGYGNRAQVELGPHIQAKIGAQTVEQATNIIDGMVREKIKTVIDDGLDQIIEEKIDRYVDDAVAARVKKIVDGIGALEV